MPPRSQGSLRWPSASHVNTCHSGSLLWLSSSKPRIRSFSSLPDVGIALFQMRVLRLKESQQESRFDNGLLLIGLLGILFYDMFLLLPALEASGEDTLTGNLFASKSILEMIQAMMQVSSSYVALGVVNF